MTRLRLKLLPVTLLAALLLTACLPAVPAASPTPTSLPLAPSLSVPPSETAPPPPPTENPTPAAIARRVLILSIDGLRPEAIPMAPMDNLMALMHAGAYTFAAQTIYPSATLPAHASMLTGMCPAKTGVTWNDYEPALGFAKGPSLFDLAHAAGLQTVMVVGKEKLQQVTDPASLDIFKYINDRDLVITQWILDNFPKDFGVLFVHFPTSDWMGHEHGWLSSEQLSVLYRADQALGLLLKALDDAGLRGQTLVIVTADHGGYDKLHGSTSPEDMTIPWTVAGPGVRPVGLTEPVSVMDTAATAAWALGLPLPPEWDGLPVYAAFGVAEAERPAPRCHP